MLPFGNLSIVHFIMKVELFSEWLHILGLNEYTRMFEAHGYTGIRNVMQMSGEDFEDVGVTKLGHIKRLQLAIRKLKVNTPLQIAVIHISHCCRMESSNHLSQRIRQSVNEQ
jgi:hypothetical protein